MKVEAKWIKARTDLWHPCGLCKGWISRGEWYFREAECFRLCHSCAQRVGKPEVGEVVPNRDV